MLPNKKANPQVNTLPIECFIAECVVIVPKIGKEQYVAVLE